MTEPQGDAPLGSWPRFYGFVMACAVAVIGLLWWFTACFHLPAE